MSRLVVTGHDDGRAVVRFDDDVPAKTVSALLGLEIYDLWSTNESPEVPDRPGEHHVSTFFPPAGGSVFRLATLPPSGGATTPSPSPDQDSVAEMDAVFPGLREHLEPGSTMHTTDSVDYGVVVAGDVDLELDDGRRVHLGAGDCVVQTGTRHAWHNTGTVPAVIAFILLGARRRS